MKSFLKLIRVSVHQDGEAKEKQVSLDKEFYKLLYKYEQFKEENISSNYKKREVILDFIGGL